MLNKKIYRTISVLVLIAFCMLQSVYAQTQNINFTSLTTKDGLSSNTVTAILKDRYGLMWFATEDGLNKFDGTNFTVYRHDLKDTTSIKTNEITCLYEDKSGNIWVGTNGGYLSIYNRKKDHFLNLKFNSGPYQLNSSVKSISGDSYGKIWVSHFGGLSIIDPLKKSISGFTVDPRSPGKLSTHVVLCTFEDRKHRMWIGTNDGLFLYNRSKNDFIHFKHNDTQASSLSGNDIRTITEDNSGNIWIGTHEGLSMLLPDGKNFKNYTQKPGAPTSLSSANVYAIASDADGKLWLGTEEGLNILDPKSGAITTFRPNKRNKHSLTGKSIRCIYIDKKGVYWLGAFQGGISKYDKNLSLFHLKQSNPYDPLGLNASIVTSFAEAGNNQVYVGTDGGGLSLFNRKTELFQHINIPLARSTPSEGLSILSMEMSRKKELWIGTYTNGLFRLNSRSGTWTQFKKGTGPGDLNNNEVFCIKEDSKGDIWIGTNGGGVNVFNPNTKVFTKYAKDASAWQNVQLPLNGYIRAVEEDRRGNMWIGSHGSGIAVLDPGHKRFTVYNRYNSKLASNVVLSIFSDSHNNLWVGTGGGGLNLLNKKTSQFISFTEKDGLANDVVYKVIEDEKGLLWLSTNKGICSFNPKTRKFNNYTFHNGVQNSNFVLGAGLRLSDGEMFFGGLEGFNHFKPSDLKKNKNVPSVLITDLKVDNKSVSPVDSSILKEHISVAKEINLDYKQNFSLSFVALNYTTPQQNQYAYKLEGFDKEWNYGAFRTASYTNLDPGTYTFRVKASNNDGVWNPVGTSIKVYVHPPFWRTIYAYILYVIAVAGALLYSRYRTLQNLKMKFALEQEKIRAKQVLEEERKEAGRIRELDNLKIKFLTNLSHEFRTPISLIMGPVDNLLPGERDTKRSGQLYMIKRNGRRLLNLVNQLLDFRKMEEHELTLNSTEGDIISFIKEVADSFRDLSERKKIDFSVISQAQSLFTCFDHDKIERILFNLLSNAFKFTPGKGEIKVELDIAENAESPLNVWLSIRVTDTGIGIPDDKKEKIFERFFQNSTSASVLNQGSGIGLSITKEFVRMHNGTIEVESAEGKGTAFIINLPFTPIEGLLEASPGSEIMEPSSILDAEYLEPEEPISEDVLKDIVEKPAILLVEDNEDFRFYLKDNLKTYYRIFEASNGKEGWQKALANHPMLIVSDINMPVMDGIELSRKIKGDKRTSHIPVILLTALTAEEEQIKGLETGANDYMSKPFNFEILNAKIRNLLILNRTLKDTYTKQIKVLTPEIEIESEDAKLLNKVLLYIEENINDSKLSVEDLSRHVGMSRSSLYNKILELTGESPVEYIRNAKLDKAAILLEKSDMNVAQVGYVVGFATPNYFAKSFKAKFNMLPSEFMNQKRKSGKVKS